ncbi:MAG: STAS domain-containing protein, partial [Spirochaetales bacterium]|nr:STAS domain-containing protein [Spirochaetales bacterium]
SEKEKVQIVLSGVNERVRHTLQKAGFTKVLKQEFICSNINEALKKAEQIVTK